MQNLNQYQGIVERAARIAITAHAGQKRKKDGFPYIIHPFMVASILMRQGFDDTVVAAALVHDVIEDTEVGEAELRDIVGDEAMEIVRAVTEDKTLPLRERKEQYIATVRAGNEGAKAVAVADKIHNLRSLLAVYDGDETWKQFNGGRESHTWFHESMLAMFRDTFSHPLVDEYAQLVEDLKHLPQG